VLLANEVGVAATSSSDQQRVAVQGVHVTKRRTQLAVTSKSQSSPRATRRSPLQQRLESFSLQLPQIQQRRNLTLAVAAIAALYATPPNPSGYVTMTPCRRWLPSSLSPCRRALEPDSGVPKRFLRRRPGLPSRGSPIEPAGYSRGQAYGDLRAGPHLRGRHRYGEALGRPGSAPSPCMSGWIHPTTRSLPARRNQRVRAPAPSGSRGYAAPPAQPRGLHHRRASLFPEGIATARARSSSFWEAC